MIRNGKLIDARTLLEQWQALLQCFRPLFTRAGWVRFALWITALLLCDEQHTLTQCLVALNLQHCWHAAEAFVEYGAWSLQELQNALMRLIESRECPRWGPYHPVAGDDTHEQRWSLGVWGTCTFAHASKRNPNRPRLLRGHNWVLLGDLLPGTPWTYLPTASGLYLRKSQLPPGEVFATKDQLLARMLRQADAVSTAPVLGIVDGGYAHQGLFEPCHRAEQRPIRLLTRPRRDARLYRPLPSPEAARKRPGRRRRWGRRLPSPKHHGQWKLPWQSGQAWIYGRQRSFRYKRLECRWAVSGPKLPVACYVFEVESYAKSWSLITDAMDLSPQQVVEAYAARFRLEDGIREHKQHLGMEEVRAWTHWPILRTFQAQIVALSLLRLLQRQLQRQGLNAKAYPPTPWNRHKHQPSLLDMRRLLWNYRSEFSQFCHHLDEVRKSPCAFTPSAAPPPRRRILSQHC
jgi:hypothetical protein